MVWTVIAIILISLVKILITCLPTGVVEWIMGKFEVHSKLSEADVTITIDGNSIEGEAKKQLIHDFNEAIFLKRQYIYPGTEDSYLYPEGSQNPIVIDVKKGKKDVRLFVFCYKDQVDVVKQAQKKVTAYCLRSDIMQKSSMLAKEELA
ncbi:YfmQ family protein [Neobacillus sp. Marseille-QA0830]